MTNYLQVLRQLNPDLSTATPSRKLACVLSGQGSFAHSHLTQDQEKILSICEKYGYSTVQNNFPYNQKLYVDERISPNVYVATVRNCYQYYLSVYNTEYQQLVARHLQPLFHQCDHLVILSYSMGLQMLDLSLPYLEIPSNKKITIFALGPVCQRNFADQRFSKVIIKGKQDYISQTFDSQKVDHYINADHYNYSKSGEIESILDSHLRS